jgi:histidyl-tRNA synthetase
MPFRRYQIQPVWRADRPQRGRYREFVQCDADVVGSKSLLNEVELADIYALVFERLGIEVEIKINSRKILAALANSCGGAEKLTDITVAIDKLDKIGAEKVKEELLQRGLEQTQVERISGYLAITGSNDARLEALQTLLPDAIEGIQELKFMLEFNETSYSRSLVVDQTLARGLNYYTGLIFEIKAKGVQMGSIGGGGRYDDLTGLFGVSGIPGVGISFGVDRIYDVMEELGLFPAEVQTGTQVLFFNLGESESRQAFSLAGTLRAKGIRCEVFPDQVKMDKQFKYAEKKAIPYVIILGAEELAKGTVLVKNLSTREQVSVPSTSVNEFNFK